MVSEQNKIRLKAKFCQCVVAATIMLGSGFGFVSSPALAAGSIGQTGVKIGQETGLPLPRFVSLKAKSVNLRVGPGRKYAIQWHYTRRGLPVEVTQEFEQWRRIRDSEGTTGWVLHSLLSGKRTAIVAPWEKPKIEIGNVVKAAFHNGKGSADRGAKTVARLQPGLMVNVIECENGWCAAEAQKIAFWLRQDSLWGVYPQEHIDN